MVREPLALRRPCQDEDRSSHYVVIAAAMWLAAMQFVEAYSVDLARREARENAAEAELRLRNIQEQLIDLARSVHRVENRLP